MVKFIHSPTILLPENARALYKNGKQQNLRELVEFFPQLVPISASGESSHAGAQWGLMTDLKIPK
jgi:hypothetical protein